MSRFNTRSKNSSSRRRREAAAGAPRVEGRTLPTEARAAVEQRVRVVAIGQFVAQRPDGSEVAKADLLKLVAQPTPVLLGKTGQKIDPLFLGILKPDALVLLLPEQLLHPRARWLRNTPTGSRSRRGRPVRRPPLRPRRFRPFRENLAREAFGPASWPKGRTVQTPIGQTLKSGGPLFWLAQATALAVVGVDFALTAIGRLTIGSQWRLAAVAVVTAVTMALCRRDAASFGFRLSPLQGWAYWARATILIGLAMLVLVVAAWCVVVGLLGYPIPAKYFYISHSSQIWPVLVMLCFDAPLAEEADFRLSLCVAVTAWLGPRAAIVTSGVLFGLVHVLAGRAGPDNLVAGFILAWAYLKSGTLVVPIALHSLGNLCAFAYQVAHFYWQ